MPRTNNEPSEFDYPLLISLAVLVGFGLVMVYSASYALSYLEWNNTTHFFARQLLWTALGIVALVIGVNIDYRVWRDWAIPIMGITLLALIVVLLFGSDEFGARRQFLNGSIQPSEVAKISIIIYVAAWLTSKGKRLQNASYGLAPFAILLGLLIGLIVAQPAISTSIVIAVTAVAMFFIAGADLLQMGIISLLGGITFGAVIFFSSHARYRVEVFVESLSNPLQTQNLQVKQAITALVEGGVFGQGLAESITKRVNSLPAVHSDSIFAIVGEELGLIGTLLILALFFFFAYRGIRIALRAPDQFGSLLAFGITTWLVFQAFINIAVITATFPFTGLPLPFFSYGGSSTVANLAAVGILLNVSRGGRGYKFNAYPSFWRRNRRTRVPDSDSRSSVGQRQPSYARTANRPRRKSR
ncbi:MAG: cell division protein FtsW [Caldilineales bacterium]|nr:cell division protein FtsW [Caldilineales bacterium]